MALREKPNKDELIVYEILRNPVLCGEFLNNIDKHPREESFEYTWYQKEMLCDFNAYVSYACARSVGKTVSLVGLITWILINNIFPPEQGQTGNVNYHVPGKNHIEPVFNGLERVFRTNSFLKHFLPSKTSGINHSDWAINLVNGASLLCRIAGQSGSGVSVIGLHCPFVIVDEDGYYPYGTWTELQPTLNKFTSGFRLIASGVPTGLRERNVLYHVDMENGAYTKHRISALQNPRFSKEDLEDAIETYGGEDSEDFIHLVLGQHGKPVFALFDRELMQIQSYPVHKLIIDGTKLFGDLNEYYTKISLLPGLPNKDSRCIIGIDLGYTEPTAIFVMFLDNYGRLRFHAKIRLNKVDYYIQEKIIDWLDTRYKPLIIGIDEGNAGKAVIPTLQEHVDYVHKNYKKIIVPINFSSQVILGTNTSGEEIKAKTKPFAVRLLQEYTNNHKIVYSTTDIETIVELERMTYTKTPTGDTVYKTLTERGGKRGEDHFTSALLCASLSYYLQMENLEFRPQVKKLAKPSWFIGI